MPDYQSAYCVNYSCETVLVKIMDHILWLMEKQEVVPLIAIDLSAAFDTVDHELLLAVLRKKFGIDQVTLKWFGSYLRPQQFRVQVGDKGLLQLTSHFQSCRDLVLVLLCTLLMPAH